MGTGKSEEFLLQEDTYHYEWKPEGTDAADFMYSIVR